MARRAAYMYGALLEPGPEGQLTAGSGATTSTGSVSLVPPTVDIVESGQEEVIDGVRFRFQLTPGTEAPSEMNFYFPDTKVLFIAENASHTMHNTLTLRGALVRDPRIWAHYLDETIEEYGREATALFACHHWPMWGSDRIVDYLSKQRDLYAYIHDQTLRMINRGLTGTEIAERFELPPSLEDAWHCRGYYGSVSHNVKAVYQRYMGWFDGNPAHLWEHPTTEGSERYVEFMGGAEATLEKARKSFEEGDYRWVAEVVNHVVFAEPDNAAALELQAAALEQLGLGAENATWRNFFLTGARELREGSQGTPTTDCRRRLRRQPRASTSSSTLSRSGSTAPAPGTSGSASGGTSTTPATSPGSRTGCSTTGRSRPDVGRRRRRDDRDLPRRPQRRPARHGGASAGTLRLGADQDRGGRRQARRPDGPARHARTPTSRSSRLNNCATRSPPGRSTARHARTGTTSFGSTSLRP